MILSAQKAACALHVVVQTIVRLKFGHVVIDSLGSLPVRDAGGRQHRDFLPSGEDTADQAACPEFPTPPEHHPKQPKLYSKLSTKPYARHLDLTSSTLLELLQAPGPQPFQPPTPLKALKAL